MQITPVSNRVIKRRRTGSVGTFLSSRVLRSLGGTASNVFRGARTAAAIAQNPVGYAAMRAGRGLIRMVGRRINQRLQQRRRNLNRQPKGKWVTTGKYAGSVRGKKYKVKDADVCQAKGFLHTTEVNGTISDPDCCYIMHSTFGGVGPTLEIVMQSLIRKLFLKHGVNITGVQEKIRGYNGGSSGGDSDGWRISLVHTSAVTNARTYTNYDFGTNETLQSLTGNQQNGVSPTMASIMNYLYDYTGYASVTRTDIIESLELYSKDGNVTDFWHIEASLNLKNETIHYYCKSELKFQNRTKAADGGVDATNINNNPLTGKLYEFTSGVPKTKAYNTFLIERIKDGTGVNLIRGAEFAANVNGLKEPPRPKFFSNCKKSSSIRLEPGAIKKHTIIHTVKLKFNQFLLNHTYQSTGVDRLTIRAAGKCAMIALEDMINVNGSELIGMAYEVNRTYGLYSVTGKYASSVGQLYQVTQNNNPA